MYLMNLIFSCFYKYVSICFNFLLIMNSVFYEFIIFFIIYCLLFFIHSIFYYIRMVTVLYKNMYKNLTQNFQDNNKLLVSYLFNLYIILNNYTIILN